MINIETVKFIKVIEELAKLSKNGIKPFSEATEINKDCFIFYDENKTNIDGSYKICLDMMICEGHHDVISYYENYKGDNNPVDEFMYGVVIDEDGDTYVNIKLSDDEDIIIENGEWKFC